jgi:hypothetical protein
MKVANVEGYLAVKDEEGQVVFDPTPADGGGGGGGAPQAAPPVKEDEKGIPREIELGPLPRPPLPVTVYLTKAVGLRKRPNLGDGPFVLKLDRDIEDHHFSESAVRAIAAIAQRVPSPTAVSVHVYLPPNHVVDMGALKAHVYGLEVRLGRKLEVRLGGELADQ